MSRSGGPFPHAGGADAARGQGRELVLGPKVECHGEYRGKGCHKEVRGGTRDKNGAWGQREQTGFTVAMSDLVFVSPWTE